MVGQGPAMQFVGVNEMNPNSRDAEAMLAFAMLTPTALLLIEPGPFNHLLAQAA